MHMKKKYIPIIFIILKLGGKQICCLKYNKQPIECDLNNILVLLINERYAN